MPMTPPTLTPIMAGALASAGYLGVHAPRLAAALATGLSTYALSAVIVNTTDVGTVGAGKGTGVGGILVPPSIIPSMIGSFGSAGLLGTMGVPLARGVAQGFIQCFLLAIANTVDAGVGVGGGKITLIPNPAASLGFFLAALGAAGMAGTSVPQLAQAVAQGLDQVLPSCTGVTMIAGSPSIYPATGVGLGKLL